MKYGVGLILEKCANYEGEDKRAGKEFRLHLKGISVSQFHGAKHFYLDPAGLPWHLEF